MFSKSKSKKAIQAAKQAEEAERAREAEKVLRKKEAKQLNEAINARLSQRERRISHESNSSDDANTFDTERRNSEVKTRRNSEINRRGSATSTEVDLINRLVQKREAQATERKASMRKQSEEAATLREAARAAAREVEERGLIITHAPPELWETGQITKSSSPARISKYGTARERMSQLQQEADELKRAAYNDTIEIGDSAPISGSKMAHIGAARAAAKVAGGVYYTLAENREMLEKMKSLDNRNKELEAEVATLTTMLADITGLTGGDVVPSGNSAHSGKVFGSPSFLRKGLGAGLSGSMRKRRNSLGQQAGNNVSKSTEEVSRGGHVVGVPGVVVPDKRGEPLDLRADAKSDSIAKNNNISPANSRKRRISDNGTRLVAAAAAAASAMGNAVFGPTSSPPAARSSSSNGSRDTTPFGGRPPNGQHSAPDVDGAPISWTIVATA